MKKNIRLKKSLIGILKYVYLSKAGALLANPYNKAISSIQKPKMLWGLYNDSGEWMQKTRVSSTTSFYNKNNINIEDNVYIGHYCILDGTAKINIGTGTQISSRTAIYTHSSHISIRLYGHSYTSFSEQEMLGMSIKSIKIGRYVHIGTNATILPGVKIGDGAVIAAGSIVSKDVNSFEVVAGGPAKVIGDSRTYDKEYLEDSIAKELYEFNYD